MPIQAPQVCATSLLVLELSRQFIDLSLRYERIKEVWLDGAKGEEWGQYYFQEENLRKDFMSNNKWQYPLVPAFLMSSWTIAVLLAVLLGGLRYLSIHLWHGSRAKQRSDDRRLPPGPRGIPILGNLLTLGDLPHRTLHQMAQKYGPIMFIRLGFVPTVVVSSAQAAELFLKTHDNVFASRPYTMGPQYVSYGNKGLLFAQYGAYWRSMRKLCTIELLSATKVDSFKKMRREEVGIFVRSLKEAAEAGAVVDMTAKVGSLIEDMTFRMLIGSKVDNVHLNSVVEEYHNLLGTFNLADFFPYIEKLDLQGLGRHMKEISRAFDGFLEKIIDDHINNPKERNNNQKDFIDVMLSLMVESEHMQVEEQRYMIDRASIKGIILDMILAAIDTSAVTIEWAFSELLKNPKVMESLKEELKNNVGIDQLVEEEDLVKLVYLDMVVKEAMRIHPIAPLLAPHESLEDITINGYHIPKKSRVIINAWAIQRDPNVWSTYDDAEKFLPERFKETNIDIHGRDFQLIPFGSGRRGCPGINLGLTVVKLVLGQLVHGFDWELPNGMSPNDLDMTEKFGLSVPRANHLLAVPSYRLCLCGNNL
ncbi:cytochrome P450 CYP736A12-like [Telopea speciosissima]|uniref:cytochrome P450 CYP736A12-like n=1 Tax=Telopea speciosissima TaxID=54955 RepID=UPI001CC47650|nr:cytochrome P450 CYP736A12-like [Telopea speciosissima]